MFRYDRAPMSYVRAREQVDAFLELTRDQQETFMVLLPQWFGPVEELIAAAKLLD